MEARLDVHDQIRQFARPAVAHATFHAVLRPSLAQPIFQSAGVSLARCRCLASDVSWDRDHEVPAHSIMIARSPVAYRIDSAPSEIISTLNCALAVNRGQTYRRRALTDRGLVSDTLSMDANVARDAVRPFDPAVDDRPGQPFALACTPTPNSAFLAVRSLSERLIRAVPVDPLEAEESLLGAIAETVACSYGVHSLNGASRRLSTDRAHRDIVEHVKTLIATRPADRWTLSGLAHEAHTSAFHLARIFKSRTGSGVHAYLRRLRVRTAVELINAAPRGQLASIAVDCGFASHSHLTRAFIDELGVCPSRVRWA